MTLLVLLEMVASAFGTRLAVGTRASGITYAELHARAGRGAEVIRRSGAGHVAFLGPSEVAFPVALFACAWAGVPLLPLSYRLGDEQLDELLAAHDDLLVITDAPDRVEGLVASVLTVAEWDRLTAEAHGQAPDRAGPDGDGPDGEGPDGAGPDGDVAPSTTDAEDVAVLLATSGTSSAPKAAVLRHRHLTSYVIGSVEFAGAGEEEATLVSVPPYHIAGVATVVSNAYAARRIVYLPTFDPATWLATVRDEEVTHAMVVPTMLARVVEHLDGVAAACPSLRTLAYGGARMPVTVLERALVAFPDVDFVNAYGLTETSSTIAVLGPDDHRAALNGDEVARGRLASVGRVVPGIEVDVRDGEIWVRGEQVSGEYLGRAGTLDDDGWFPTRDRGHVDADGYLFVEGRADDTIIRGGENIAPAEVEDVLLTHPAVLDVAVVGLPDEQWGQRLAAAVVRRPGATVDGDELRTFTRQHLRSSRTPDVIAFRDALPHTDTGKLLRRAVLADLEEATAP